MNTPTLQFLAELKENNNREWFMANKSRYDVLHGAFVQVVEQLITQISLFDPDVTGLEAKKCLFRIYRDIRFSPDKTPYKTHFSAYIAKGGKNSEYAGYYIHLEPDHCLLSGGIWMPRPELLRMLRRDVLDHAEELMEILENPAFKRAYPSFTEETLSRVPAGFPPDSPYGHLLKRKDFCVYSFQPDVFFLKNDWMKKTIAHMALLYPFNRFFNYTVSRFLGHE